MIKRISLLVLNIIVCTSIFALPVDRSSALQKAKSFINQHELNLAISETKACKAITKSNSDQASFYIFNSTDNNGYIVVSADDRTEAVIGYSDEGSLDLNNLPSGLEYLFNRYEEELNILDQLEMTGTAARARRVMSEARYPVKPITENLWGHRYPFNKFNPDINDSICLTGCATAAIGTIMGHFKYPATSHEVKGYITPTRKYELEDLPSITFDWDNMKNYYLVGSYTSVQGSAVGWLMRYIGQELKSDYDTKTTGALVTDAPSVLRSYGYNSSVYWPFGYRTMNEWEDLLYKQMVLGRPVIAAGFTITNSGHVFLIDGYDQDDYFHMNWCWEGSSNGYFKLSLMSPYKNTTDSYNYNHNFGFIYNIYPKENEELPTDSTEIGTDTLTVDTLTTDSLTTDSLTTDSLTTDTLTTDSLTTDSLTTDSLTTDSLTTDSLTTDSLTTDSLTTDSLTTDSLTTDSLAAVTANLENLANSEQIDEANRSKCLKLISLSYSGSTVSTSRKNMLEEVASYEYGLGLYDEKFKLVKLLDHDTYDFKAESTVAFDQSVDFGDVTDGTYFIFPISRIVNGDGIWHYDQCGSTYSSIKAVVEGGSATFVRNRSNVYNSLEFRDSLPFNQGAVRVLNLNVTNNMMEKMNRWVYLFDNGKRRSNTLVRVPMMTTDNIEIEYYPQSTGTHTLKLCTDTLMKNVIFTKELEAVDAVTYKLKYAYEIDSYDSENNTIVGNVLRMKVKITNTGSVDYDDYIRFLIRYTYWHYTQKLIAHIPVGETKEFYFEDTELNYGQTYPLTAYYKGTSTANNNTFSSTGISIKFKPLRGIVYWNADGERYVYPTSKDTLTVPEDVVVMDLTGLTNLPASIVPNSNPNTLYYVTKSYSSLKNYNQIINLKASKINLTDGYSCYVPKDFTATEISYTRTFDKGFMGVRNQNNWSTIVLPFDVQTVYNTTDNKEIDWFKPKETTGKDFWLRRFFGEEGFTAYFTNAETLDAKVPYIITVPGNYNGEDYSLVGKPLVFSATNADVLSGKVVADAQNYNFEGSLSETSTSGKYIYQLDEELNGNNFIYINESANVKPFRAYFTSETEPLEGTALYVASYNDWFEDTNAIHDTSIFSSNQNVVNVYSISGTKVMTARNSSVSDVLQSLPQGLYIINGKKFIK